MANIILVGMQQCSSVLSLSISLCSTVKKTLFLIVAKFGYREHFTSIFQENQFPKIITETNLNNKTVNVNMFYCNYVISKYRELTR